MTDDTTDRIIRTLGSNGSLSLKSLTALLPGVATLEQELKTLVRRRRVEEQFAGSYALTPQGRKDFKALAPSPHAPGWAHHIDGMDQREVKAEFGDATLFDDGYCEECGGDIEEGECICEEGVDFLGDEEVDDDYDD